MGGAGEDYNRGAGEVWYMSNGAGAGGGSLGLSVLRLKSETGWRASLSKEFYHRRVNVCQRGDGLKRGVHGLSAGEGEVRTSLYGGVGTVSSGVYQLVPLLITRQPGRCGECRGGGDVDVISN